MTAQNFAGPKMIDEDELLIQTTTNKAPILSRFPSVTHTHTQGTGALAQASLPGVVQHHGSPCVTHAWVMAAE